MLAAVCSTATACQEENPFDFGGPRDCTIPAQNEWVYDLMLQVYLWNEELPEVDPSAFDSPHDMVTEIRYPDRDRWSRVSDRATSDALFNEGKILALGIRTQFDVDDNLRLAFVHADSPAGKAGLRRSDIIVAINGVSVEDIDEQNLWNDIYGPNEPGVVVELEIESAGQLRTLEIAKDWFAMQTVPRAEVLQTEAGPVGYLLFTTFVATSDAELEEAFARFVEAGVTRVVVDLRYNGGGLLSVARHLIDLLVGRQAPGDVSYQIRYGGVLSEQDTQRGIATLDHSLSAADHIVFLTTSSTASASELVINGVRPHARVSVVGSGTAGKPVGSRQWPFCDKVAAPITFRLLNADGWGDYYDGFTPECEAGDTLGRDFGDPEESMLAEAVHMIETGRCTAPSEGEEAQVDPGLQLRDTTPIRTPPGAYPGIDELRGLF